MLGATLGIGIDQLLRRYSLTDMSRAVVIQASAAAMLEEYLDTWQKETAAKLEAEKQYLRPRFSPGYGDFSIREKYRSDTDEWRDVESYQICDSGCRYQQDKRTMSCAWM